MKLGSKNLERRSGLLKEVISKDWMKMSALSRINDVDLHIFKNEDYRLSWNAGSTDYLNPFSLV